MNWSKELKGKYNPRHSLKACTTFRIGGRCKHFFEPLDQEDLSTLVRSLKKNRQPVLVLGSGSNILVADKGIKEAVIRLSSPYFRQILAEGGLVTASAGCPLGHLVSFAASRGLSGQEFLSGIPGTIGGALIMNAGQSRDGAAIGDLVEEVKVMDYNGNVKVLKKKELRFGYRRSNLSRYIILSAKFKLAFKGRKRSLAKIREFLSYRNESQDRLAYSAGCIFKNPGPASAGRLIESCGLKGKIIGGARVSGKHANFIINNGNASSKDVLSLIKLIKKEVKDKFNIDLATEIRIWQ